MEKALLEEDMVVKFVSDFYPLESARHATVTIKSAGNNMFEVTIVPTPIAEHLLAASFRDGQMSRWSAFFK